MSRESLEFRSDITEVIRELGEQFMFSRGSKKFLNIYASQGKIELKNIDEGAASSIQNQARRITVEYKSTYVPAISDVATDTHGNIFTVQSIQTIRFQDTTICYAMIIV